jgi:hypothetical protein
MSAHVGERLGAYLDAELPSEERAEVSAHLRECPRCARLLEEMTAVDDAARSLSVEAPEGYFDAFPSKLRRRLRPAAPRRFTLPVWTLAAAAALLLAVITPLTLRQRSAPAGSEGPARELAPPAAPQAESAPPAAPAPAPGIEAKLEGGRLAGSPRGEPPTSRSKDATAPLRKTVAARPAEPAQEGFAAETAGDLREEEAPPPAAKPQPGYATAPAAASTQSAGASPENRPAAKGEPPEDKVQEQRAWARERPRTEATSAGRVGANALRLDERDLGYRALLQRTATTAEDARALREAWRAFAQSEAAGPRADEARVRVVQTGAQAFRLSGDAEDRAAAERDARAYLARPDALQAERVRAILATLDPVEPRQPER